MKICSKCKETKPFELFTKNRSKKDGYGHHCKSCILEYRQNNRELYNSYNLTYYSKNKEKYISRNSSRRAKLRDQTPNLSDQEKQEVENIYWLSRDLRTITGEDYHVDHIKPLSKGGLHHPENLQILPADLNLKKGNKEPLNGW